ncbi:hypothetical protein KEM52_006185 [Ascosphaera acerosa]|nr:hypothetical protein KEM52_006185 [Ascosphaera acerosa]
MADPAGGPGGPGPGAAKDPDYVNESKQGSLYAIYATLWGITMAVALTRLGVRMVILKGLKLDDCFMILALLCFVVCLVAWIMMTKGGMGRHSDVMTPEGGILYMKGNTANAIALVSGLGFVKISVGCFLLQIGRGLKSWARFTHAMIAIWDPVGHPGAKCYGMKSFLAAAYFNSSMNIMTDLIFATMPIPLLSHLQMNWRKKCAIIGILCLGYLAGISAIVKLVYQVQFQKTPDLAWNPDYSIWAHVELCVGIISACLPMLKSLFKTILRSTNASHGRTSSRNRKEYRQWLDSLNASGAGTSGARDHEDDGVPVLSSQRRSGNGFATYELNAPDIVRKDMDASASSLSTYGRTAETHELPQIHRSIEVFCSSAPRDGGAICWQERQVLGLSAAQ